jgi:hypothetical protein
MTFLRKMNKSEQCYLKNIEEVEGNPDFVIYATNLSKGRAMISLTEMTCQRRKTNVA